MNQQALADALDLTFQQVQKYEHGANRVSASRLAAMATILAVRISYFFADLQSDGAELSVEDTAVRDCLAKGLVNTLNAVKKEGDLSRRDALLEELRALARGYPEDAGARKHLASGLFNTLNAAETEEDLARRDALLEELRALARSYPDDAAVREQLTRGLLIRLNAIKTKGDFARRDAVLGELRALARSYPDDAAVRQLLSRFGNGIGITLPDC
jgi:transcriptional regulator with XRE-family HTH domain